MVELKKNQTRPRIAIWVEARRGVGHFRIAASLARALEDRNCEVLIATSRRSSFDFFYSERDQKLINDQDSAKTGQSLPPISKSSESAFIDLLSREKPDAVVLEMWPMRRAVFDSHILEAIANLKQINPKAKVFSLVRDVYGAVPRQAARPREAVALLEKCVDQIIVRGDGQIRLEESWPELNDAKLDIVYAGYFGVSKREATRNGHGDDWVVSMGGGWFNGSEELSRNVASLHQVFAPSDSVCRFYLPASTVDHTLSKLGEKMKVLDLDSKFRSNLKEARLAIMQAGYNSVIETLDLMTPAVFIPARNEFTYPEQNFRLQRFLELGIISPDSQWQICENPALPSLSASIEAALKAPLVPARLQFNGDQKAAEIICNTLLSNANPQW